MNTRKSIKIAIRILIALLVLAFLALVIGDFAINRYLNADGNRDLSKYLPINGALTYDRVSIHPFRDFPDLSVNMKGIELADSLVDEHKRPPLNLDELNIRVSVIDWSDKEIAIESIDMEGLTINLYDRADGYSNIASLIRKKVEEVKAENKKAGLSVVSNNSVVHISDVILNKIDEKTNQSAQVSMDEIILENKSDDSNYDLALEINNISVSELQTNSKKENPIVLNQSVANVLVDKDFSTLMVEDVQLKNGHIHLYKDSLEISNYARLFGGGKKTSTNKNPKAGGFVSGHRWRPCLNR